ncbi:aminotransferase class III-fold pyridoxal phosphate-dependent enzyme [Afifella sp. YEN Y35]|uniref:aminotransferase class III-fold pyridoxal phosphate-dependent enzyme n=1 Tax=Afifella sp. YEN Y35 TaxID=3388337 RepID=UPI0039DFB01E
MNEQPTYFSRNRPISLEHHWLPFTPNRDFRADPRLIARAEGMYYYTPDERPVLDMSGALWCSHLGHGRKEIGQAIAEQFPVLDYAPSFGFGHTISFELADRLSAILPDGLGHILFTNSGSESCDTAIKVAYAYHHARGQSGRKKIIGRQKGYHGVGFGGLSAGGITANRTAFGSWLPADHLRHTHLPEKNAFTRGLPEHGVELAEELAELIAFHDASTVAAVVVEPVIGAGGVYLPPKGYLKRLREICDQTGVLLILDEVITGFGRLGSPFASQEFDVKPDITTMAKGLTAATVPMGAVAVADFVHDEIMARGPEGGVELLHGYTYSAHPLACAASIACLDVYERENLLTRASGPVGDALGDALFNLRDLPEVVDIRHYGFIGAVEFRPGEKPGKRGQAIFKACWKEGLMVRALGDIIAVSPPLVIEQDHVGEFAEKFRRAVETTLA